MTDRDTILVVDDAPANLKLLTETLTAAGYRVLPADSGELALVSVAASPPDLILLDIRMPGLDGFEVCRRLKARPETEDIPIILISAFAEIAERVEGFAVGAADFVTKPFQPEELVARVRTHVELRRLRVRLEQQAADLQRVNSLLQSDIVERIRAEEALRTINDELLMALANVKSLSGLLPICSSCKKIRDDKGYWSRVETYIEKNSGAKFTHGLCPACFEEYSADLDDVSLGAT